MCFEEDLLHSYLVWIQDSGRKRMEASQIPVEWTDTGGDCRWKSNFVNV